MTIEADDDAGRRSWGDGEPADRTVVSGPWTLALREAELADIHYAGRPVLRAIRFVVRDHDWRTAENLIIADAADRPEQVKLTVRSLFDGVPVLEWDAELELGSALRFAVWGTALRAFRRNRIGLIVLHSPELAGGPLEILHPDGGAEASSFPIDVAAHQPALDVVGYRWSSNGVDAELQLAGDVFEMEDQRNWTDASYKTYSTPLARPFPVLVESGDVIKQSLTLSCRSLPGKADRPEPTLIMPSADQLPMLQLGASTAPDGPRGAGDGAVPITVEVPADERRWPAVLQRARQDAAGGDLDVRIVAAAAAQIRPVVRALAGGAVSRIGVYDRTSSRTTDALFTTLCRAVDTLLPGVELVAGTRAHFTELNRTIDRFADHRTGLTFSITPQMHDRSRAQVIESLPIQRLVVEQAVRLAAGRPLHVGPVTLRSRFNAVATTAFDPDDHGPGDHPSGAVLAGGYGPQQVPEATDPRQASRGVAAWTVCSVAALAVPEVSSITLFEAWGPRGVRPAPAAPLDPAGQVIDWIRTGGPLAAPPAVEILDGPTAAIGLVCQELDGARQLLIGNPGDRPASVRIAARTTGEVQGFGAAAALFDGEGGSRITVPTAGTVKIILDR